MGNHGIPLGLFPIGTHFTKHLSELPSIFQPLLPYRIQMGTSHQKILNILDEQTVIFRHLPCQLFTFLRIQYAGQNQLELLIGLQHLLFRFLLYRGGEHGAVDEKKTPEKIVDGIIPERLIDIQLLRCHTAPPSQLIAFHTM